MREGPAGTEKTLISGTIGYRDGLMQWRTVVAGRLDSTLAFGCRDFLMQQKPMGAGMVLCDSGFVGMTSCKGACECRVGLMRKGLLYPGSVSWERDPCVQDNLLPHPC